MQSKVSVANNSLETFAFEDFSVSCENGAIYQYVRFLDILYSYLYFNLMFAPLHLHFS